MSNVTQTEVPRSEWPSFCDRFSRQHRGWLTTIAAQEPPGTAALPLQEIVLDEHDGQYDLAVVTGTGPQQSTWPIHQPSQISFEQDREGGHVGLTIREAGGRTTLVRFRAAAHPEMLDDIAPSEW